MAGKMKTKMIIKEKHSEESETMNEGEKKNTSRKLQLISSERQKKKKDI